MTGREAIHGSANPRMDCFVASAPRNECKKNSRRHCCRRPFLIEKPHRLFRIFEFRRSLQCLLGGVHRCQPLVVLVVVANVDRRRRYRDIALAHSQETTDRQDQRVDLMILDGDVGDLADRLILLVIDVQAFQFGTEHLVFGTRRELGFGGRLAGGLGALGQYRARQNGERSSNQCNFLHHVSSSIAELIFVNAKTKHWFRCFVWNNQDAARRVSSQSRASSDLAESVGNIVASVTIGSGRASRLPWEVWRMTLQSRRAIIWAVRKSVSANATTTDPSS